MLAAKGITGLHVSAGSSLARDYKKPDNGRIVKE